jgi:hypothetical protein
VNRTELWRRFGDWRRARPFWGGLLMVLSAAVLFLSANLTLKAMQVHFGQEGFLSYLLPLMLLLCGLLVWFTPAQRLFYAVIGLLTAVYSLIGLNLGGFGVGMLLGIAGGALVIAWTPAPATSTAPPTETTTAPATETPGALSPESSITDAGSPPPGAFSRDGVAQPAGPLPVAGSEPDGPTMNLRPGAQEPPPFAEPGRDAPPTVPGPTSEKPSLPVGGAGPHRKALGIIAVPLAVGLSLAVAAHAPQPARAEPACPKGMPSRSTSASPGRSDKSEKPTEATSSKPAKQDSAKKGGGKETPKPAKSTDAKKDDTGNPIVDGWNDFVEGVGNLFGAGDDKSPSPDPTEPANGPTKGPTKPGTSPAKPGTGPAGPGTQPDRPPGPGDPKPTASAGNKDDDEIPCLGPRLFDKKADPGDVPPAAIIGGLMEGDKLTMYDSTYDGVTTLDTADGKKKVLEFSMRQSVTTPFKLTMKEPGGHTTVIDAGTLTTTGNVRFYTPKFEGKLFGLIPVTFTPDQPPPLTLPKLVFTDVKIDLSFVRCDVLTGRPLRITELR